jgi:hypothetical protein
MTDHQPDAGHDRPSRSRDRQTPADDPDAPGAFVDDEESDEVPEPNEPA